MLKLFAKEAIFFYQVLIVIIICRQSFFVILSLLIAFLHLLSLSILDYSSGSLDLQLFYETCIVDQLLLK